MCDFNSKVKDFNKFYKFTHVDGIIFTDNQKHVECVIVLTK